MEDNVTVLPGQAEETLYSDVCQIIDGTRGRIATFLNTEVCMTNWYIGKRIKEDVLFNQRAEYGKQVIKNLSLRLIGRYGSGWSEKKLRHCIRSAETFSELHAIARQKVAGSKLKKAIAIAREHYQKNEK